MNPATYEYTAASIQSLQPGDSNLGAVCGRGVRTMMRADAPERGVNRLQEAKTAN